MVKVWLRAKLRDLLGLDEDRREVHKMIADAIWRDGQHLLEMKRWQALIEQALGRIIAKLDPMYGKPETKPWKDDPAAMQAWADRKAESDRLAEEAIKRLEAEDWARKHTLGEI